MSREPWRLTPRGEAVAGVLGALVLVGGFIAAGALDSWLAGL